MANTTWSSTDKLNITLSGTNNLTATSTLSAGGVRTIDRQGSGKYYFEYVCTTWSSTAAVGVANAVAVLSTANAAPANACFVYANSGNIWINNVNSGSTLGARANGDVIGIALDQDNKRIWFRVAPAGNWNGSGTANPATGVGGISTASISTDSNLAPLYGLFSTNGSGYVVTANFGDTAFSGTVPVGFTSGFPTGTPPLIAANTQIAIEEWADGNPAARVSQIAVEQWASVSAGNAQALATIIGLEQWATVTPSGGGAQARVMVLA